MTKVKDLIPNTNATLRVRVCAQGSAREVQSKKGYPLRVCSFQVGDETGTIEFSAFGKDVTSLSKLVGKVLDIKDAWVKEWNEIKQLSLGKSGVWEVVEDKSFPLTSDILNAAKAAGENNGDDEEDDGD
nr:hypothetical protein [Candidatus Sigynarchaeota archaeon]